jgi:PAS domain S-box-containing protein
MIYFGNRANFMTNGHPGIWIVDATGKTVFADDQMAAILGVATRAELIANPSSAYVFPEDLDTVLRMFDSKKHGESASHQCRLRRKDGSAVLVHVQVTPMKNDAGEFSGAVSMFTCIEPERGDANGA